MHSLCGYMCVHVCMHGGTGTHVYVHAHVEDKGWWCQVSWLIARLLAAFFFFFFFDIQSLTDLQLTQLACLTDELQSSPRLCLPSANHHTGFSVGGGDELRSSPVCAARTESRLPSPTESSSILSVEFYSVVCLSHSLSIIHLQDVLAAAKLWDNDQDLQYTYICVNVFV